MGLKVGNVVGISIGGASPIAALVLAVKRPASNKEAVIDITTTATVDGVVATPMQVLDVPHADDGPGHYLWNYGGPELLVRKAADPLPINASAGTGTTVNVDPTA